jgi:hypothetical protein
VRRGIRLGASGDVIPCQLMSAAARAPGC